MAIVSAYTIIRTLSLFHLTLAFFFLTAPHKIVDQNLVFVLGTAMGLPDAQSFERPSAPAAFLSAVLALLGFSDLVAVALPEEIASHHWSSQTPIRLLFFFLITGYTYTFKPGGLGAKEGAEYTAGAGDNLKNNVVFTWGFVEMVCWFWVYVTLRDERRQMAALLIEKRKAEADSL
ncbi:MAG: hypothetical protein M1827_000848 [Pycnora praestabilis]|nr:MAG: hypothetical protein M1827_000848 [Pycnora praestabilis]